MTEPWIDLMWGADRRSAMVLGCLGVTAAIGGVFGGQFFRLPPSANLAGVNVRAWGCQYQNIDLERIAATSLDLIVLDPFVNGQRIAVERHPDLRRKPNGARRLVLAYMSVGEAESYRDYWQGDWKKHPPAWLGHENARWPGSFAVQYWHPEWRDLLLASDGSLDLITRAGFDGVFLDRVDAYGDWPEHGDKARSDMVELIVALSARAKANRPNFLLVAQNAEPLLMSEAYRSAINAVSKESLLYNLRGEGLANPESDVEWSLGYLREARDRGLPVLAIEYLEDSASRRKALARLRTLGFVAFFGNRLLDRLPT